MTNWNETHWTRILNVDLYTGEGTEGSGTSIDQDESNGSTAPVVRRSAAPASSSRSETYETQ